MACATSRRPGWVGWALRPRRAGTRARRGWDGGVGRARRAGLPPAGDPDRLRDARARAPRRARRPAPGHRRASPTSCRSRTRTRWPRSSARPTPTRWCVRWARPRARGGLDHARPLVAPADGARRPDAACGGRSRDLGDGVVLRDGRIALAADATLDAVDRAPGRARAGTSQVPLRTRRARAHRAARATSEWTPAGARRVRRAARGGARCRSPCSRPSTTSGVLVPVAPRVGARAGAAAAQRVPPLHRRPALARSGGGVRSAARPRRPAGAGFDGDVARHARRATCCCSPRCSTTSPRDDRAITRSSASTIARDVAARIGLDAAGAELLAWAVAQPPAPRRHRHPARSGRRAHRRASSRARGGRPGRNALLYALTIGDSRATGRRRGTRARPRWCASCT